MRVEGLGGLLGGLDRLPVALVAGATQISTHARFIGVGLTRGGAVDARGRDGVHLHLRVQRYRVPDRG